MDPERGAVAVEAVSSDRMTFRSAAKTSDIFVGSLRSVSVVTRAKLTGLSPALYYVDF